MRKSLTDEQCEFLRELVVRYGDALTKYAYRFFGYQSNFQQISQDAVQETFLKAVKDVEILMTHPNVAGWLKVSLRNVLLNIQRENQRRDQNIQEMSIDYSQEQLHAALDAFESRDQYPRLKEVIGVANVILTESEVGTFYDHFLVGLTTEETALLEAVSVDSVRGRINRIRKKLRKYFGPTCSLLLFLFYIY